MTNKQMEKKIRQAFQNVTPDRVNAVAAKTILSDEQNRKGAEKPMKTVKTSIQFRAVATLAASIAVVILIASALLIRNPDPGPSAQPGESTPSTESTGTTNCTPDNLIGIEAALDAANAHIANTGIPALDLVNISWELDEENGRYYYEISRWQLTPEGGLNVSFVIDAQSGNVVDYKSNATGSDTISKVEVSMYTGIVLSAEKETIIKDSVIEDGNIGKDLAIKTALDSVGIPDKSLVTNLECEEDADEPVAHYDVSFEYEGAEFEIEVGMYNPTVLSTEKEPID